MIELDLQRALAEWDQKSKTQIASIYRRFHAAPDFLPEIVRLCASETSERGATWLLKHHLDSGGDVEDGSLLDGLYATAPDLKHWEARLHMLQCVDRLPIPRGQLAAAERFVRSGLTDDAKFVRAWAYSAFHDLARQYPTYREEASRILENALNEETAGSVLARVRRKIREGF